MTQTATADRTMSQQEARTRTNAIPVFVAKGHYTMESKAGKRAGSVYNLRYDYILQCWTCDCYDYKENGNHNCKHLRRFNELARQSRAARAEQPEQTSSQQIANVGIGLASLKSDLERSNTFITEMLLKQTIMERELEAARHELSAVSMVASSMMREMEAMRQESAQQIAAIHVDMQSQLDALKAKRTRATQAQQPQQQIIVPNITVNINNARSTSTKQQPEQEEIITMEIPEGVDMDDPNNKMLYDALIDMARSDRKK
jgi:hypothetical protein